jgi:hypothetical protein
MLEVFSQFYDSDTTKEALKVCYEISRSGFFSIRNEAVFHSKEKMNF